MQFKKVLKRAQMKKVKTVTRDICPVSLPVLINDTVTCNRLP